MKYWKKLTAILFLNSNKLNMGKKYLCGCQFFALYGSINSTLFAKESSLFRFSSAVQYHTRVYINTDYILLSLCFFVKVFFSLQRYKSSQFAADLVSIVKISRLYILKKLPRTVYLNLKDFRGLSEKVPLDLYSLFTFPVD